MTHEVRHVTDRPPGMGEHGGCRVLCGTTMGGLVHGSLVFYDDDRRPPSDAMVGDLVIAAVKGGVSAPYIRFLEFGSRDGVWTLRSVTGEPLIDVELEWAALVKWVRLPAPAGTAYLRAVDETARPERAQ